VSRFSLLHVSIDALTKSELLADMQRSIVQRRHNVIYGNHNLHSLYLHAHDAEMQRFYRRAARVHVDGMGVILLGRLLGLPLRREHRTGYLDWFEEFLAMASLRRWRVYFIGGSPEIAAKAVRLLETRFPGIVAASHHGYLTARDLPELYDDIRAFEPHILLAGMGMPVQERFILDAIEHIQANIILQCGAAVEFLIGEKRPAPRILGQLGLEWLFRLATEPRRLAGRYLVEPFHLVPMLARELWHRPAAVAKPAEALARR
jgi:N-acetylglucosaminyldiphosphoundecaprenol N-acetyl-beta-D-mannosaminyltransferase